MWFVKYKTQQSNHDEDRDVPPLRAGFCGGVEALGSASVGTPKTNLFPCKISSKMEGAAHVLSGSQLSEMASNAMGRGIPVMEGGTTEVGTRGSPATSCFAGTSSLSST